MKEIKAPFPRFGGKSRAAPLMWERLGDPANLVIPFFGTGAELWARPSEPGIETVNDIDHYIANFWRAVKHAPDEVAEWADGPVVEADLHARHLWLVTRHGFRERMRIDPTYFDAQIAGWWVWGACAWIGSGWCEKDLTRQRGDGGPPEALPHLGDAGMGVHRKLPHLGDAGRGVHRKLPHLGDAGRGGALPDLGDSNGAAWGRGIDAKDMRKPHELPLLGGTAGAGVHAMSLTRQRTWIIDLLTALAVRLRRVRVACGDFERVLGDSVTWRHGRTAVILDPPYADGENVYAEGGADVFYRAGKWAEEHGNHPDLRVVLCGYEGTWTPPDGWLEVPWKARGGYGSQRKDGSNKNADRERLWFSPHCLRPDIEPAQRSLFV